MYFLGYASPGSGAFNVKNASLVFLESLPLQGRWRAAPEGSRQNKKC
jgi:hypothetical protein